MSLGAVYGPQPAADEAPARLLPDGTGQYLGYPGHCGVLESIPRCYPTVESAKSQYPYGALAFQLAQENLANGNSTAIKDVGAYLGPDVTEPVAAIPGMDSRTGLYVPGPRGGFGGVGACGVGCGSGVGVMF